MKTPNLFFGLVLLILLSILRDAESSSNNSTTFGTCNLPNRKKFLIAMKPPFSQWSKCLSSINDSFILKVYSFEQKIQTSRSYMESLISQVDYVLPLVVSEAVAVHRLAGHKLLFPSNHSRNLVDDKSHFTRYMLRHFPYNIPRIFYLDGELITNPADINYKGYYLSKPPVSYAGRGIKTYPNSKFNNISVDDRSLVMEYLNTTDEYGYHFVAVHGRIVSSFLYYIPLNATNTIIRGLPPGLVRMAKPYPFDLSNFTKLVERIRYNGPGQSSFRIANYDKRPKFFEINSRFGGTVLMDKCLLSEILCF